MGTQGFAPNILDFIAGPLFWILLAFAAIGIEKLWKRLRPWLPGYDVRKEYYFPPRDYKGKE